ncbi:MAG: glycosyltransferase [candidate division WOR-3 bacterium]
MKKEISKYVEFDENAKISLAILQAYNYERVPDKFNVLFTMWETEDLPRNYVEGLKQADFIIVPCEHNKRLHQKYVDKPIEVCQEGCDTEIFKYKKREFPQNGKPFRFLWVGAPNPRKGYEEMAFICQMVKDVPGIEIYLKTTMTDRFEVRGNVIFDSRNISIEEMVNLYHSANCFVLPSRGEGWGLTLVEAMSTGLPCIAPRHTGIADFFDDYVGYTVKWELKEIDLPHYNLKTSCPFPDPFDIFHRMVYVVKNYKEALQKGKKASERVRNKFTWEKAGLRLYEILKEVERKYIN